MQFIAQDLDEIVLSLQRINVEWKDDTARRVIDRLQNFPGKETYSAADLEALLDSHFDDGVLILRLFLGLSKDQFTGVLTSTLDPLGIGIKSYKANRQAFLEALIGIGALEAMAVEVNRKLHWSDVLLERLRSGRGSAISGQRRGRGGEDFAEVIVAKVFGSVFDTRATFTGPYSKKAKCDFAIPSKDEPRIVIESKVYGATGSKMTDIIGDAEQIIAAKRPDTAFLLFTDGLTWKQRKSDLRKLVELQNAGGITRIYTTAMVAQFEADLRQLKSEYGL
ncbi:MAG: DpnII family type II restriction endonuclease [Gemmatimonadota bacterium]